MTAQMLLSDSGPRVATDFFPRDVSGVRRSGPRDSMEAAGLTIRSARIDGVGAIVSFLDERRSSAAGPLDVLSRRERQITELVARGLNNTQIAAAASISRNTVKQHLKHVFEKMQIRSRAELAAGFTRAQADAESVFVAEKSDS
jgi:DNA-binding CsgD family transcriptional regulator